MISRSPGLLSDSINLPKESLSVGFFFFHVLMCLCIAMPHLGGWIGFVMVMLLCVVSIHVVHVCFALRFGAVHLMLVSSIPFHLFYFCYLLFSNGIYLYIGSYWIFF